MFGAPWWLALLALVGALALANLTISLFFAIGRRPGRTWATETPPVRSEAFLEAIAACVNGHAQLGGEATLLDNGDAYLPVILETVAEARRSVNVMVYIWEPGVMSDRVFDALIERARAGVQVRLLLDGLGGFRTPGSDIARLEEAGGVVARFRPIRFGLLTRFHKRNHRRAIVIDGRIGFTGGAAIGDKWLGNAQDPDHWRDSMVRVTGRLAANLQSAFSEVWAYCRGEILAGADFFPEGGTAAEGDATAASTAAVDSPTDGDVRHITVASSPSGEEHPLRLFFLLTFLAARERLWIATPYFVPDRHTRAAVAQKARDGLDVRLLLPNELTDARPIRRTSHRYYDELLDAGVRIWEYQPTMMHAKHVVVDGHWSVVGSANMDIRSKELNLENVLGILDAGFAGQIERSFQRDLDTAREIRLEEWRRRPFHDRVIERIAALPSEQY